METGTNNRPFQEIVSLEAFLNSKGLQKEHLRVAKTNNGKILLTALGSPVATIHRDIKGADATETKAKLAGINLCFGMPKAGEVDNSGRPALPCAMESVSSWEELDLF